MGTISDWKAACAAYAARAGLTSARLAKAGFTGPSDIFSGRHGFFAQVSGKLEFSMKNIGQPWMIMKTHVKYYPAEHHSQSAIEAAVELYPQIKGQKISKIEVECFDVGVDIIGSEKEKWAPETRETADHSLPYLVAISLAEGIVNLDQYKQRKYLNKNIRKLMNLIHIKRNSQFTKNYPGDMASTIRVFLKTGIKVEKTIRKPKGYAGRPLTKAELIQKFGSMAQKLISPASKTKLVNSIFSLDRVAKLSQLSKSMIIA
jgi:2-methylcitrate dehydratase